MSFTRAISLTVSTILVIVFVILVGQASSADPPKVLHMAYEEAPVPPWTYPDGTGLNVEMMKIVGQKLGFTVEWKAFPWKRCLEMLKENQTDAVPGASFKEERKEIGKYPLTNKGELDNSRCMMVDGYSIYRLKGNDLDFDGKTFINLKGQIGAQRGYSVVETMKNMGITVDEGAKDTATLIMKLEQGRIQGAVAQALRTSLFLKSNPELAAKIEKTANPFTPDKPFFLMLSKAFCQKYPEFSEKIWDTVKEVRDSKEYLAIVEKWNK